jgi:hypothetical protein
VPEYINIQANVVVHVRAHASLADSNAQFHAVPLDLSYHGVSGRLGVPTVE